VVLLEPLSLLLAHSKIPVLYLLLSCATLIQETERTRQALANFDGPPIRKLTYNSRDDTLKRSADLGGILAKVVVEAMKAFTSANNALMRGDNYLNSGDIRLYLKGGLFVNFGGVDKNAVTGAMNALLIGQAINQLYRTQKIFIMGGGACGDNQGIGGGPADYGICRDGKAWYLYYWQENDVISLTSHQWGWTAVPPGADKLGQGDYANVKVSVRFDIASKG
jgi:hypothetical protein